MKIENISIRVLMPSEGMWLYNEKQKILSVDNRVFLGAKADASDWTEITLVEKERLEALWAEEQEAI